MPLPLSELVQTSTAVASTRSRKKKIEALASCLGRLDAAERAVGASWLAGELPGGKLGLGPSAVHRTADVPPSSDPGLSLSDAGSELDRLRELGGSGSQRARLEGFARLLGRATAEEQRFLRGLVLGELRQGALVSLVVDAVARAARVSERSVRRAHMFSGALGPVVDAAFSGGEAALARFDLVLFEPVQPMLAQPAEGLDDAWARLGDLDLELKMDGARVQIHRLGSDVRIFTRRLNDVTAAVPDVVRAALDLGASSFVLDAEVIALDPDGRPRSFQTTMSRFGRARDTEDLTEAVPLSVFAFDCLHLDGQTILDRPARERVAATAGWLDDRVAMPRLESPSPEAARAFVAEAYARGHEGAMAKSREAPYDAGRRGAQWLKIKQAFTVDLVVLGAEWGSGRRKGWLSNLHLGARGPDGAPVMVGKTFKGLTDELLRWQTQVLLDREVERWAYGVRVRPELVVEIALGGVQASPRYPGGLSLRFARVRRYRPDKSPARIDTLDRLRQWLVV